MIQSHWNSSWAELCCTICTHADIPSICRVALSFLSLGLQCDLSRAEQSPTKIRPEGNLWLSCNKLPVFSPVGRGRFGTPGVGHPPFVPGWPCGDLFSLCPQNKRTQLLVEMHPMCSDRPKDQRCQLYPPSERELTRKSQFRSWCYHRIFASNKNAETPLTTSTHGRAWTIKVIY